MQFVHHDRSAMRLWKEAGAGDGAVVLCTLRRVPGEVLGGGGGWCFWVMVRPADLAHTAQSSMEAAAAV